MVKASSSTEKREIEPLLGKTDENKRNVFRYGSRNSEPVDETDKASKYDKEKKEKVSFRTLFRYATGSDLFLIFLGTIFAVIHGAGFPLLAIIFGDMSNVLLQQQGNPSMSSIGDFNMHNVSVTAEIPINRNRHLMAVTDDSISAVSNGINAVDNNITNLLPSPSTSFDYVSQVNSILPDTGETAVNLPPKVNDPNASEISSGADRNDIVSESTSASVSEPTTRNSVINANSEKPGTTVGTTSANGISFVRSTTITVPFTEEIPMFDEDSFNEAMTLFSLYYVAIGVIVFVATFLQTACWQMACERQIYRMRQEFFYQALRQEIGWFDRHQSGEFATKLSDDLERIREGIGDKFSLFIQNISSFIAGFVVGFIRGWELTLVVMSLTPLLALSSAYIGRLIATSTQREQQKYAEAGGIAEEVLSSIKTVTAFNGQDQEVERYKSSLQSGFLLAKKKYTMMSIGIGFTFLILYCAYALAFWYGSELILAGTMDPGDVYTVFFAVLIGSSALGQAAPPLSSISVAKGAAATIFNVLDTVPKIDPYSNDGKMLNNVQGRIEFNRVRFRYPARPEVEVLKDFNLLIKPGQTMALCGSSGSGKSTIVNLLLRFYDTCGGKITLDGHDIKSINVAWLRHIIGVVSQEPVLFDRTIAENIRYGRVDVTYDAMVEAAKMANVHDFICSLPQSYSTLVGEGGAQLSGGQKQRISIARALVRDPKILLLDEATSALDSESESVVQEALDKAREGRTTIIIAHRLSTIQNADVINAMEFGRIKESGTHDELMEKGGVYYSLVMKQTFESEAGFSSSEGPRLQESDIYVNKGKAASTVSIISSVGGIDRQTSRLMNEAIEEKVDMAKPMEILKACKPEWLMNTIGCIGCVITGISLPAFAIFFAEMFEVFSLPDDQISSAAFFWSMMYIVLAVVQFFSYAMRISFLAIAGEKLTKRLRYLSFKNIIRQDIGWFDDKMHSTGKISTRLATDAPMVKSAAGIRIGSVLSAIVTMSGGLIIAYIFGWKLALAITAAVPILILGGAVQMKIAKGNQKRDTELMADAGKVASEALENIRTVQSLTREETFFGRYVENLLIPFIENKKQALIYGIALGFSQSVIFFMYAGAFRFGAYLVTTGEMAVPDIYKVFFALAFTAVSVGEWSSYLPDYTKAKLSAGLMFHMMNLEPKIDIYSEGGIKPDISGEIQLRNVYFRYPSRPNVTVLRGLSLEIQPGKTVALVGPSGCGKSTIVSLIERFYDPLQGQVLIDGYDMRTVNLRYIRDHIGIVSQEPVLFNCTIKDNIIYGLRRKVYDDEVIKSCKAANIHEFINSLPDGYATMAGEKGTQLSGGQKQRIAIARAIIRNPKILLLDEATSALDTESEKLVQDALDTARTGRTCIVVAHRLSTIQNADLIAVVDKGRIVEIGTHSDLIAKKKIYYRFTKKQRIHH